jgi:hypothetical protein
VSRDASITGKQEINLLLHEGLQAGELNAMRFTSPDRNMIDHIRIHSAEGRYQQCCRCLPVNVEITPYPNAFLLDKCLFDAQDRFFHIWQFKWIGRRIGDAV